jgi:hypothetical protein
MSKVWFALLFVSVIFERTAGSNVRISTLASLSLPAAIEAVEQPIGLPPTLLKRSEEVRSLGGAQSLTEMMQTLTVLATQDSDLLDQVTIWTVLGVAQV